MSQHRNTTDTTGAGIAHGSSTGAPGIPTGLQDRRAQYNPATTGVNPATGAAYTKSSTSKPDRASPSNSYDAPAGDDRIQHAPSTAQRVQMEKEQEKAASRRGSKSTQIGQDAGQKVQGVMAGVHVCILSSQEYSIIQVLTGSILILNAGCRRVASWGAYLGCGPGIWIG